jgi:hypothetical protein
MPATYRLLDVATGAIVADRIRPAHTHWTRLRGLLGTAPLTAREGLWLRPCRQVHMFWMRYAIDVVFLDADLRIVHTVAALAPGTVSPKVSAATSVVELAAGVVAQAGLRIGHRLALEPVPVPATAGVRLNALGR